MRLLPNNLSLLGVLCFSTLTAAAASLTQITTPFGPNPRNVSFYIYVPDSLPPNPAILVNPHWCHGTAEQAYAYSQYATLASRHGFIVIYPGSPNSADQCWDVSSRETLTHDAGGDSLGIVSMVRWTIDRYDADPRRVFVTGVSSGAMMTQVLLGAYPDVFAAGAAFAGVPFGCFAAPGNNSGQHGYWNADCAEGRMVRSAEAWGDLVRAAYPGYRGWRPKVQLFHGTNDEIVSYVNHMEGVKQWTDVLGLDAAAPAAVVRDTPLPGWTKTVYGEEGWLEAYSAEGVPHDIRVQEATVVEFFQLDCTGTGCFSWGQGSPNGGSPSSSATPASSTSTAVTAPPPLTSTTFSTAYTQKTESFTSTTNTGAQTPTPTTPTPGCTTRVGGVPLWAQW
jgi:acetylxylan esterase